MDQTFRERRGFSRMKARVEVHYWLSGESKTVARRTCSEDISEGGIRLTVQVPLETGQKIRCVFRQPGHEVWLPEIQGMVAWSGLSNSVERATEPKYQAGVTFSDSKSTVRNRIRQWLTEDPFETSLGRISVRERWEEPTDVIGSAYDGCTVTYRLLRSFGWGLLNNMGYFNFPAPFSALNLLVSSLLSKATVMLPEAQTMLVRQAAHLLDIQRGEQVLDVACGRGKGSYIIANLYPRARVKAVDLLPENVQVAQVLFANTNGLKFLVDDAMNLRFPDQSFDKVLCLEAAFHFPDRGQFIREAYRVLRDGGRFVIVDFMWKSEADRMIRNDELTVLVRDIWKFQDFWTRTEYLQAARLAGFRPLILRDWSRRVTVPVKFLFLTVGELGATRLGRALLVKLNPLLAGMTREDWQVFRHSAQAHGHVGDHVEYVALVLEKPSNRAKTS